MVYICLHVAYYAIHVGKYIVRPTDGMGLYYQPKPCTIFSREIPFQNLQQMTRETSTLIPPKMDTPFPCGKTCIIPKPDLFEDFGWDLPYFSPPLFKVTLGGLVVVKFAQNFISSG